jgi:hypothetical protein
VFELLTTDEFAAWFFVLDDGAAEEVAAALDVIAQLGTGSEAPGSTEWLLWYEHPSLAEGRRVGPSDASWEVVLRLMKQWGATLDYVKRALKHLESAQFVARLRRLTPRDASVVADAVSRIRAALKSSRLRMLEVARLERRLRRDANAFEQPLDITEVRHWYFAALAAAGFDLYDFPPHSAALREIALQPPAPGLRLLYGIDTPHDRGLVVLGEWLDRSFYGDSVRRAEQSWQRFLDGSLPRTQPSVFR